MRSTPFPRQVAAAVTLVSGGALVLALIAQYGFDLWPCLLCFWQRAPYALTLGFGALMLLPGVDGKAVRHMVFLCVLLFLINAGIAFFHMGVEYKWWEGLAACGGALRSFDTKDLMSALSKPLKGGCEEAAFRDPVLNLSMAGWNVIVCGAMAAFCLWAALRKDRWQGAGL